jgi:hypothetical protein
MATGLERAVTARPLVEIRVYGLLTHAPSSNGAIDFLEFSALLRCGDQHAEEPRPMTRVSTKKTTMTKPAAKRGTVG